MTINRGSKGARPAYRITADRDGLVLTVNEEFWNDTIVAEDGTTQLDINVSQVVQEIRAALYYVATVGTRH